MPEPSVAAVILNYNRYEDTVECLRSLLLSSYLFAQVIVVDNASTDGSEEKLRKEFPSVTLLQTGKNLGYARGMNVGIHYALQSLPKYIFVANSDTEIEKNFLQRLVNAMENDPSSAAATGTIYYHENKDKIWFAGGEISFVRGTGICRYDLPAKEITDELNVRKVSFISGCGVVIRSSTLSHTNVFDERYFMYVEDLELSLRLQKLGFNLIHVPRARMYHKVGNNNGTPFQVYFGIRNRLLFVQEGFNIFFRITALTYLFMSWLLKMMYWSMFGHDKFKASLYGIEDFLAGNFYEGRGVLMMTTYKPK